MSAKQVCLATLVTALVGLGAARGQYTGTGSYMPSAPGAVSGVASGQTSGTAETTRAGDAPPIQAELPPEPGKVNLCLSDWIVGTCPGCGSGCGSGIGRGPGCCGPVGGNGPVQMEIYLQGGPTVPFADGVFGHTLKTGWEIEGGGRSLFFNADETAACVIDLGISNMNNDGRNPSYEVPLSHILIPLSTTPTSATAATSAIANFVPRSVLNQIAKKKGLPTHGQPVTLIPAAGSAPMTIAANGVSIEALNRTFVNLGFGRDWYLNGPAPTYLNAADRGDCCRGAPVWRVGFEGGGRYGTAKLDLHEIQHRTDTIAGLFVAGHADVEVPCGCCIFQAGFRVEYDYTWTDLLQQSNDTDLQDFNFLFTIGARY
jgi:hypothetical protein